MKNFNNEFNAGNDGNLSCSKLTRFEVVTQIDTSENFLRRNYRIISAVKESPEGEFVRFEQVKKLIEEIEGKTVEKRIEKIEKAIHLINAGKCPECGEMVVGHKFQDGAMAHLLHESYLQKGINPNTGHRLGCSLDKETYQ